MEVRIFGEEQKKPGIFTPVFGFIVCHTEKAQGARAYNGVTEYNYCLSMVNPLSLPTITRDLDGLEGASMVLSANGVNTTIEPHFNSFNGSVGGMELLILEDDEKSESMALKIVDLFKEYFPERKIRGNGVKKIGETENGYFNLKTAKEYGAEISILSELFFGDNPDDFMTISTQRAFWVYCMGELKGGVNA